MGRGSFRRSALGGVCTRRAEARRLEEAAKESNLRNRSRSAGEVSQETSGYFSYDEVKNMSRTEIRENYNNILLSMQKWH